MAAKRKSTKKRKKRSYVCVSKTKTRRGCAGGAKVSKRRVNPRRRPKRRARHEAGVVLARSRPRKRRRVKRKRNPSTSTSTPVLVVNGTRRRRSAKRRKNPFRSTKRRRSNPGTKWGTAFEYGLLALVGGAVGLALGRQVDSMGVSYTPTQVGLAGIAVGLGAGAALTVAGVVPEAAGLGFAGALAAWGGNKVYNAYATPSTTTPATTQPGSASTTLGPVSNLLLRTPNTPGALAAVRSGLHAVTADLSGVEGMVGGLGRQEFVRTR